MTNAVFNPKNLPVENLPIIYGFNNGSGMGGVIGMLIAEDGTVLGSHASSDEAWLPYDLGVEEGRRPARHETFRKHYPDGYRMEFVSYKDVDNTPKLVEAFALNAKLQPEPEGSHASVTATLTA